MFRLILIAAAALLFASHARAQSGQVGVASVYWEGQRIATGERCNPNGMTAAHKTLPLGAIVQVSRVGTKRSVVIKINDRGPYIRGRIIDLARGSAKALGVSGLARVRVDVMHYGRGQPLEPMFRREAFRQLEKLRELRPQRTAQDAVGPDWLVNIVRDADDRLRLMYVVLGSPLTEMIAPGQILLAVWSAASL